METIGDKAKTDQSKDPENPVTKAEIEKKEFDDKLRPILNRAGKVYNFIQIVFFLSVVFLFSSFLFMIGGKYTFFSIIFYCNVVVSIAFSVCLCFVSKKRNAKVSRIMTMTLDDAYEEYEDEVLSEGCFKKWILNHT